MADEGKKEGDSGAKVPEPSGGVSKEFKKEGSSKKVGTGSLDPNKKEGGGEGGEAKKPEGLKKEAKFGPVFKGKKEGEVWTNKEGEDDKSFVSVLEGKASGEALSGSVDFGKKSAKLTVVEAKAEVTVVHGQVDLIDKIKHLLFGEDKKPTPPTPPTTPMAARVSDLTMHLAPLAPGPGSTNVFIGGMPAWRVGLDQHLCPAPGAAPHGGGPATPGATTVLINGAPAARATDFIVEPTGGPDVIAVGCPTVFIGIPTPPPPPKPPPKEDDPWVIFESVAEGNIGKAEGSLNLGGEGDLAERKGKLEAKAEVSAAVLKGELPLKVRVRIPFTSYYVGLGVKVEGSLLSVGAGAEASVKVNDGKTLFSATAGAKAEAGIGGAGAKFSLDVSKK